VTVTVTQPSTDLAVTAISVPSGTPGKSVTGSVTVKNIGTGATTPSFESAINLNTTTMGCATAENGALVLAGLAPGASRVFSIPLTLPTTPGAYTAVGMADSDCVIPEASETNNAMSTTYQVTNPAATTDLITTAFSVPSGTPGKSVTGSVTVQNIGTGATTPSFESAINLTSSFITCASAENGALVLAGLAPGASRVFSIPLTLPGAVGTYNAAAMADSDCVIPESNETNNARNTTYQVVAAATQCTDGLDNDGDGRIDINDGGCHSDGNPNNPGSYVPSDNTEAGEPSPPTATISASPTSIVLGGSSTVTWSSTNATSCVGGSGQSLALNSSAPVSPTTTTQYFITCTGVGGTSPTASATVTVTAPVLSNLRSQNLIHLSGTLQNGQTVRFRATVNNNSTVATPRTFSDEFSYQWNGTGGTWTPWSVIPKSVLAAGASSQDTSSNLTLSAPGSGTQNLYVQHCIDSTLVIAESNESVADNCEVIGALSVSPAPACSDGLDNDGDGKIDYPADPGCSSAADTNETDPPACSNGIDDDGDGLSDSNDPSCHTDGNASNPGSYLPTITSEDDVSIVASPALVRSGSTSTVTWSAGGTPTSCLVTGPGVSSTAQSGSASTGVITEQRTYLISCDYGGFQRTAIATIIVLPAFEEF
jgi:hypothetical protein